MTAEPVENTLDTTAKFSEPHGEEDTGVDGVTVVPSIQSPGESVSQANRSNHQHHLCDQSNGGTGTILALGMSSWKLPHVWLKWSLRWIKKLVFPTGLMIFSRVGHWAVPCWCWEEETSHYSR